MSEMRLIDADALGIGKCNPDIFPPHYGDGWNAAIKIIEQAPTVPAVPLADHERMKREMYSKITFLKKQLDHVTAERNQAVEDLRTIAQRQIPCYSCKHDGDQWCLSFEACKDGDQWQWRGVAEKQTLSTATRKNILNDFMKGVE